MQDFSPPPKDPSRFSAQEQQSLVRGLVGNPSIGWIILDAARNVVFANEAAAHLLGQPLDEIKTSPFPYSTADNQTTKVQLPHIERRLALHGSAIDWNEQSAILVHLSDDTAAWQLEKNLAANHDRQLLAMHNASTPVFMVSPNGNLHQWNEAFEHYFQPPARPDELHYNQLLWDINTQPLLDTLINQVFQGQAYNEIEITFRGKDGKPRFMIIRMTPSMEQDHTVESCIFTTTDITESTRARMELAHSNRVLKVLSQFNRALIQLEDEEGMLAKTCQLLVEAGGYRMAWIGAAQPDEGKTIRPVSMAGHDSDYVARLRLIWGDGTQGQGPCGQCIRQGKPVIAHNSREDPYFAPWWGEASHRGTTSSIALPISLDGNTWGCLNIYAAETDAFDPQETALLGELIESLEFGLLTLRDRQKQDQRQAALQNSKKRFETYLEGTDLGWWDLDTTTDQLVINDLWIQRIGYASGEINTRQAWKALIHPDDINDIRAAYQQHEAGKTPHYQATYRIRSKNGDWLWVTEWGRITERDPAGKPLHVNGTGRDITAQKQMEDLFHTDGVLFRKIIENTRLGVAITNPDGNVLEINRAFQEILGYSPAQATGKNLLQLTHPGDTDRTQRAWQDLLDGRQDSIHLEKRCLHHSGQWRWVNLNLAITRDTTNKPIFVVGMFEDITDRKSLETLNQNQLNAQRLITDISSRFVKVTPSKLNDELISATRLLGQFTSADICNLALVSRQSEELIFGYEWRFDGQELFLDESKGRNIGQLPWLAGQLKQGQSVFIAQVIDLPPEAELEKNIFLKKNIQNVLIVPLVDGNELLGFFGVGSYQAFLTGNEEEQYLFHLLAEIISNGVVRKRTEEALRESENRFRAIFEHGGIGMALSSLGKGHLDNANPAFQEMLGYTEEELRQLSFNQYMAAEDREVDRQSVRGLVEGQFDQYKVEKRYIRKDGARVWGRLTGSLVRKEDGTPSLHIAMVEDVTQRKEAEEALRYRLELEGLVSRVSTQFIRTDEANFESTLQAVLDELGKFIGATYSTLDLFDLEMNQILFSSSWIPKEKHQAPPVTFSKKDTPFFWSKEKLKRHENVIIPWVDDLPEASQAEKQTWQALGVTSVLAIPVEIRQQTRGFLGFICIGKRRDWSSEDIRLLEIVGDILNNVLTRRQNEAMLKRQDAVLTAVSHAASLLLEAHHWKEAMPEILSHLGMANQVSRAYLFRNQTLEGCLTTSHLFEWCAIGITPQIDNPNLLNLPVNEMGLLPWAEKLEENQTIQCHIKDLDEPLGGFLGEEDIQSILIAPIQVNNAWWGIIGFDACDEEREWAASEVEMLRAAASILGSAIQRHQYEDDLRASQERLRLISDLSTDYAGSYQVTPGGKLKIEWQVGNLREILGVAVDESSPDGVWEKVVQAEDLPILKESLKHLISDPQPGALDFRTQLPDGSVRWLHAYINPVWDENENRVVRLVGALRDNTEAKQAEEEIKRLYQVEREGREFSEALREIGVSLTGTLDLEEILDDFLVQVARVVPYDTANFMLVKNHRLYSVRRRGYEKFSDAARLAAQETTFDFLSTPKFQRIYQSGKIEVIPDTHQYPDWENIPGTEYIRSWIGVPIFLNDEMVGFFSLDKSEPGFYQPEHGRRLVHFALQAQLALKNAHLFSETVDTLAREKRLDEISRTISSVLDLPSVLEEVLHQGSDLINADGCILNLISSNGEVTEIPYTYHIPEAISVEALPKGKGVAWKVIQTGESILTDQYHSIPEALPLWKDVPVYGFIGVPLTAGTEKLGGIGFFLFSADKQFTKRDLALAENVAQQAAVAIQNANLYRDAQRRAEEAETLREAAAVVASALELDKLLDRMLDQLNRVVPSDSASLFLLEDPDLRLVALRGFEHPEEFLNHTYPAHSSLFMEARSTQRPVILKDAAQDPRFAGWGNVLAYVHGWMGIPLISHGEVIGYLTQDSQKYDRYNLSDAALVQAFANQAAVAIENARLFKRVQQMAITDYLTNIFNRRHIFELGQLEIERSHRYRHDLSIILFDLDNFKTINDTYGHLVGDQVLREVTRRLQENLRTVDLLGRYGGDEFIILLPETSQEMAIQTAERVRMILKDPLIETTAGSVEMHCSLGVASLDETCTSLDILIDRADKAQYQSKRGGKNRVTIWSPSTNSLS